MSEKHLTESAWKTFATKEKFKDTTLSKALSAYEKLGNDEFEDLLDALEEIQKTIATLLKTKEAKANDDVTDYLDEVEREVPKARRAVEAAQKKAEESEEEEEAEDVDPMAVKKKVMEMLNQVKTKGPEDKQIGFMAVLAKGHSAVLLAKKIGSAQKKALQEMLPNVQGPKFIKGECMWENNIHTFVVEKVPGGLGKKLQKAIFAETGIKFKVRVRSYAGGDAIDADDELEGAEDEGEGTSSEQAPPPPPPAPPAPPAASPQRAAFLEQLKVLKPDLDKVIAANLQVSAETKTVFAEVGGLARGGDFEGALREFGRLEKLVKAGLQQLAQPAQSDDVAGKFRERLAAFLPKIKELMATNMPLVGELRTLVQESGAFAKAGNYQDANRVMDRAEAHAKSGGQPSAPQPPVSNPPPTNEATPSNESNGDEQNEADAEQQPDSQKSEQAEWDRRLAELEPGYLEAVKAAPGNTEAEGLISRLRAIWNLATSKADQGAIPVAMRALEQVDKEDLFNRIRQARATGGGMEENLVEKRKFLLSRFQQIMPKLSAELDKLRAAIAAEIPEDEEDPDELDQGIDSYLDAFVDSIRDEIDDAINAGDMKQVAGMRARIEADPMIKHLMDNPFVNGSKFQTEFLDALSEVESNLAA